MKLRALLLGLVMCSGASAQTLPSPQVATPTLPNQAAPKSYVDLVQTGTMAGGDPTGAVDSSAALLTCMTQATARGGVCNAGNGRYLLNPATASLTVPPNVTVRCGLGNPGMASNTAVAFNTEAALIVPAGKSITLQGGAGLEGCLVMRQGLTIPAADASLFSGTGIIVTGGDAFLRRVTVLGFNQCVSADTVDRLLIEGLNGDCNNGLSLSNSFDSARLSRMHFWPWATVGGNGGSPPSAALIRSGTALNLFGRNDDTYVADVLTFGYQTGVLVGALTGNTGNIGFGSVWADDTHVTRATPSSCMTIQGNYDNVFITRLWTWTCAGLHVKAALPSFRLHINQYFSAGNVGVGLDIDNGTTYIDHADISNSTGNWAVGYNAIVATLDIGTLNLHDLSGLIQATPVGIAAGSTTDNLRLHNVVYDNSRGANLMGANLLGYPVIASAATIALPNNSTVDWQISGTAAIGTIQGPWGGRDVRLHFTSTASVNTSNNVVLAGGVTFSAAAGSILALSYDIILNKWVEEYRR